MNKAPNGCNGTCCERFVLPFSFEEFQKSYELCKATGKKRWGQIDIIGPMLIPLDDRKPVDWNPADNKKFGKREDGTPMTHFHYTCKHFDKETRLCGIHETKPKMCSDYNYGNSCNYENCNFKCNSNEDLKLWGKENDKTLS